MTIGRRIAIVSVVTGALLHTVVTAEAEPSQACGALQQAVCTSTADQARGDFHGLIMVPGQPSILETAARSGTKPGCGDCLWTVVMACPNFDPSAPDTSCVGGSVSAACEARGDRMLFRVFLTDADVTLQPAGTICLGGNGVADIVPVGDIAIADVSRYLKDVHPPNLVVSEDPSNGAPAGMPTYFMVRPPTSLSPVPFGGPLVTETITIKPATYDWTWGDGQRDIGRSDAGAPYPNDPLFHTYSEAGRMSGTLTTHWSATYTVTVAGETFGPYDVTDTVPHNQSFNVISLSARSSLVSQG